MPSQSTMRIYFCNHCESLFHSIELCTVTPRTKHEQRAPDVG